MSTEEENTLRALKDQELLVSSRWCLIGIHTWTRWRVISEYPPSYNYSKGAKIQTVIQEKACAHCNTIRRRKEDMLV